MANTPRRTSLNLANEYHVKDIFYALWKISQTENHSLNECIRFHIQPQLSYFNGGLHKIKYTEGRYQVSTNVTGLVGAHGTLPLYLRENLLHALKAKSSDHLVIYDWLQESAMQLSYKGWLNRRIPLLFGSKNSDINQLLQGLSGSLSSFRAHNTQYFTAFFANKRRPKSALEQMLRFYLKKSVKILGIQGEWVTLPKEQCTYLNHLSVSKLGMNTLCGDRICSFQEKFILRIGIISGNEIEDFMPGMKSYTLIKNMITSYFGRDYGYEMHLLTDARSLLPCNLSEKKSNLLGQYSFLSGAEKSCDYVTINVKGGYE